MKDDQAGSRSFLAGEVVKYLPQQLPQFSVARRATGLWKAHPRILALPPGMRQALHSSRHRPFSFR
jgi:hypothetical protein